MKTPFAIAIRIVLIIFSILSVTLGLAFGVSEYELTKRYVDIFQTRRDTILSLPDALINLAKEPRRMGLGNSMRNKMPTIPNDIGNPPSMEELREKGSQIIGGGISRNIIIENASGSVSVYGNLRSENVSLDFIQSLPENSMVERSLEGDACFFYAFSLPS